MPRKLHFIFMVKQYLGWDLFKQQVKPKIQPSKELAEKIKDDKKLQLKLT